MFQAGFPPVIRSSNCTHSMWYVSSLLAATASVGELALLTLKGMTSFTVTTKASVMVCSTNVSDIQYDTPHKTMLTEFQKRQTDSNRGLEFPGC